MKKNDEVWFLFQVFDEITERWSPVYCAPTKEAARLECKDLQRKSYRAFTMRPLGNMQDNNFVAVPDGDEYYEAGKKDEVPAARADV